MDLCRKCGKPIEDLSINRLFCKSHIPGGYRGPSTASSSTPKQGIFVRMLSACSDGSWVIIGSLYVVGLNSVTTVYAPQTSVFTFSVQADLADQSKYDAIKNTLEKIDGKGFNYLISNNMHSIFIIL